MTGSPFHSTTSIVLNQDLFFINLTKKTRQVYGLSIIRVPPELVEHLKSGKRPPVHVTINGHSYRCTVSPYGWGVLLPVSAENRVSAGVEAGDEVEVDIELDAEPREVTVPPTSRTPSSVMRRLLGSSTDCPEAPSSGLYSPSREPKQPKQGFNVSPKLAANSARDEPSACWREERAICQTGSNAALHGASLACFLRKPPRGTCEHTEKRDISFSIPSLWKSCLTLLSLIPPTTRRFLLSRTHLFVAGNQRF